MPITPKNEVDIAHGDISPEATTWVESNFNFTVEPEMYYETQITDPNNTDAIVCVVFYKAEGMAPSDLTKPKDSKGLRRGGVHIFSDQAFFNSYTLYDDRRELATYILDDVFNYVFASLDWDIAIGFSPDTPSVNAYEITAKEYKEIQGDTDFLAVVWRNLQPNVPTIEIARLL